VLEVGGRKRHRIGVARSGGVTLRFKPSTAKQRQRPMTKPKDYVESVA
jgi:hypothetical protein